MRFLNNILKLKLKLFFYVYLLFIFYIYYNNRNNKLKYQNEWWTYTISRIWSTRYLY